MAWYGATHQTPETKVKVGLIRLDTKLWEIENKSPKCSSEMTCVWQREGIIKEFILSQDKEKSVPILLKTLQNKKEKLYVRAKIIEILAKKDYLNLSQEEIYPYFLPIIKDKTDDSKVRENALVALKGFRTQELVYLEMEIAGDTEENENLRSAAVINLGETKEKGAVDLLINLLKDKSYEVLNSSIDSLGDIGDKKAIPFILTFLESEDDWLRIGAETAIKNLQSTK